MRFSVRKRMSGALTVKSWILGVVEQRAKLEYPDLYTRVKAFKAEWMDTMLTCVKYCHARRRETVAWIGGRSVASQI